MKQLIAVIVVGLAAYLGYKFEPQLRFTLTGIPYGVGHNLADVPHLDIDPSTLRPDQLPKEITIFANVPFRDSSTGLTVDVPAGSKHRLVRIEGTDAIIEVRGTSYRIKIPISKTDLMQQLSQMSVSAPQPSPAEEPTKTSEPTEEAVPAPQTEASPALTEPPPAVPETSPTVTEPHPPSVETTPVDPLKLMRENLQSGKIKEFNVDQVVNWNEGGTETIDGTTYSTASVSYETDTILGRKTMQAKALIRNGTVEKWIWAKSGIEIK